MWRLILWFHLIYYVLGYNIYLSWERHYVFKFNTPCFLRYTRGYKFLNGKITRYILTCVLWKVPKMQHSKNKHLFYELVFFRYHKVRVKMASLLRPYFFLSLYNNMPAETQISSVCRETKPYTTPSALFFLTSSHANLFVNTSSLSAFAQSRYV